jgi:7 transmembrane receptor (rhodopsin family)
LAGNVFVIAAILLERHLQSVANYLIVSLAVADLMVACLVMPLGAVYEVSVCVYIYFAAHSCERSKQIWTTDRFFSNPHAAPAAFFNDADADFATSFPLAPGRRTDGYGANFST